MKLFNRKKGFGAYIVSVGVHNFALKPQQWSEEIPDDLAKSLLEKYPKELTSDAPSSASVSKHFDKAVKEAVKDKDAQIAELQAQLRKAQALALATPVAAEPVVEAEKPKRGRPANPAKAPETASE